VKYFGGGSSTLQGSYDISSSPEFTTSITKGSVDLRQGSDGVGATVLTVQQSSGNTAVSLTSDGGIITKSYGGAPPILCKDISNKVIFQIDTSGAGTFAGNVEATSFNNIGLISAGTGNLFLNDAGSYSEPQPLWSARMQKLILFVDAFGNSTFLTAQSYGPTANAGTLDASQNSTDNVALLTGSGRIGVATITSAIAAGTGYSFGCNTDTSIPAAIQDIDQIHRVAFILNSASASALKLRFGLGVAFNAVDATDQVSINVDGLTATGYRKKGATINSTSSYTLSSDTWYVAEISTVPGTITYSIYSYNMVTQLFTATITTNIPTTALQCGFAVTNGTTASVMKLCALDYIYSEYSTGTRG